MAFFGSDGLEHQLRQLKAQLSSKDHEITSIRNELKKKADELNDTNKLRETAEYKVQTEADRALKAENALQQRSTELSNIRLQYDNLESSLRSANQKLKVGEKENGRLQYDLDVVAAEALKEEQIILQTKIKDLESRLKKSEQEKETIKAESSKSGSGSMKRSATDFFGAAITPAPKRSSRRRSNSLSSDNKLADLEAELESLRATQGPSAMELEKLQAQLLTAKRELDKATNAKLAMERASQRELAELKSQLEDANFELEDWRRNGGAGGKVELERVKKDARIQMETLLQKVERLGTQLEAKSREVSGLEDKVGRLSALEDDFEKQAETIRALEASSSNPSDNTELQQRIGSLETELSQARASSTSSGAVPADRVTRRLQRENRLLKAEIESLKDDLQQQDDEILRLRGAVPLPGSPSLGPKSSPDDSSRLVDLEHDLKKAQEEVAELRTKLEEMTKDSEERETAFEAIDSRRSKLEDSLSSTQTSLEEAQTRAQKLDEELKSAQQKSTSVQAALETAQRELEGVRDHLTASQQQLAEQIAKNESLVSQLQIRSHDDDEVRALQERIVAQENSATALEKIVESLQAQENDRGTALASLEQERDAAQNGVSSLREEVACLMDKVVDAEDRLKDAVNEKKAAVKNLKEKLRENAAEADSLRLRLEDAQGEVEQAKSHAEAMQERYEEVAKAKIDIERDVAELRDTLANRSTESEARGRDEILFDNREEIEKLQQNLATEKAEHAKDLESATFSLTQDLEDAKRRIIELEQEVQALAEKPSPEQKKQINLLQDKLQRLRKERDELRVSLNFVNHEHRFAQQAAEADRASTEEQLERARKDLEEKTSTFASLEAEHLLAKSQLDSMLGQSTTSTERDNLADKLVHLGTKLQTAATAKEDLASKISELEIKMEDSMREHQLQAAESGTLVSELAIARSKTSKAESEMNALRRANREHEIRIDRLQATLDARMEKEDILSEINENTEKERPGSAMGHHRRRSGVPSPTFGMVESLKVEKADLLGRISRRDNRIESLTNELKQAKVNLRLAEDAAAENCEEKVEMSLRVTEVQADLDSMMQELEIGRAELQSSRASIESMSERIAQLESELLQAHSQSSHDQSTLRDMVLSLAIHRKTVLSNREQWSRSVRSLKESEEILDKIRSSASTAIEGARDQLINLTSKITALDADLEAARAIETTSRAEISRLEGSLTSVQARLSTAEESAAELEVAHGRISQLEADLAEKQEEIKSKENDIATLLDKLALGEKNRSMSEADSAAHATTLAELESANARVKELEEKTQTLLENLADLESSKDEMAEEHAQSIAKESVAHSERIEVLEKRVVELEQELQSKVEEMASAHSRAHTLATELQEARDLLAGATDAAMTAKGEVRGLRQEVERLSTGQSTIDDLTSTSQADKATIGELRSKIEEIERASATVESEKQQLSLQVAQLEHVLTTAQSESSRLQAESYATADRIADLESSLAQTTTQLGQVKGHVASVESKALNNSRELQDLKTENEEIRDQLDAIRTAGGKASSADVEELQEKITELEASLTLKVQEVDEADDRVREAYKDKAKLEKKVAKLQRQLAAATTSSPDETAANTAANKVIPPPASVEMPPPPVPSSARTAPQSTPSSAFTPRTNASAPTPSPRQPLRPALTSVNVFEPRPSPSGLKRAREEKGDEKPLPAECILLPPASISKDVTAGMPKSFSRTAFTPRRDRAINVFDPNQQE